MPCVRNGNTPAHGDVLAHRGLWQTPSDANSPRALRAALEAGFGVETDIRDCGETLVISHDMPRGHEQRLEAFLDDYVALGCSATLALNIKADGLASAIRAMCDSRNIREYFCFDMSVPDLRVYLDLGVPAFARLSEYEPSTTLTHRCSGVWLDAFEQCWFDASFISALLASGRSVCVVSPELHGRPPEKVWQMTLEALSAEGRRSASTSAGHGRLLICTDYPTRFPGVSS